MCAGMDLSWSAKQHQASGCARGDAEVWTFFLKRKKQKSRGGFLSPPNDFKLPICRLVFFPLLTR